MSFAATLALPTWKNVFGAKKILPAGVFYVPLRAKFKPAVIRHAVLERTPAEAQMAYQHSGRFDGNALQQLDNRGFGKGDQLKFTIKKNGDFDSRSEAMSTEAFAGLLKKIEDDLRRHGERIFSGDIAARPYRKGNARACDQCKFQAVCRFDSWIHPFNVLRKAPGASESEEAE